MTRRLMLECLTGFSLGAALGLLPWDWATVAGFLTGMAGHL